MDSSVKKLVKENLDGWYGSFEVFQMEEFLKAYAACESLSVVRLGKVFALFARKPLIGYTSGFIGNPEVLDPGADFLDELRKIEVAHIKIHTNMPDILPDDFITSPDDQFDIVVDVSKPEEEILKSVKRKRRQALKKSAANGIEFKISKDKKDILLFCGFCRGMLRQGVMFEVPNPELVHVLLENNLAVLGMALYDGKVVGGALCLCGRNLHGWLVCIDKHYRKTRVGDFLYYSFIKWAHRKGYRYFSFGHQSLTAWPSITSYKLSFNPILVPSYDYEIIIRSNKYKLIRLGHFIAQTFKGFADSKNCNC